MTNKFTWWEKTVEYNFVLRAACDKSRILNLAVPLAGPQEGAGDSIFSDSHNHLILIEFKRKKSDIASEKCKFKESYYEKACVELGKIDSHHFLVYGRASNNCLGIVARSYFSEKISTSFSEIFSSGKNAADFKNYLKILLSFKKPDGRSSSGASLGLADMANIIGISVDGLECAMISLDEYWSDYCQELHQYLEVPISNHTLEQDSEVAGSRPGQSGG